MCDVCDANRVLSSKGGASFNWNNDPKAPKDSDVYVEAKGKSAEVAPCEVRIRRRGTRWSRWFKARDLASVMGGLGTDVKWEFVNGLTKQYLAGKVSVGELIAGIIEMQTATQQIVDGLSLRKRRVNSKSPLKKVRHVSRSR